MSSPRKKNTGTTQATSVNAAQMPTTTPYIQSSTPSSSAVPFSPLPPNTSSIQFCPSAYTCGQQNTELKQKVEELEERLSQVEETAIEKRAFLKKAESLLMVFKIVLVAIPVTLFIALAIVQYFVYDDSKLLNWVTGIIGIATVHECFLLPVLWKSIDSRLEKVEEQLRD